MAPAYSFGTIANAPPLCQTDAVRFAGGGRGWVGNYCLEDDVSGKPEFFWSPPDGAPIVGIATFQDLVVVATASGVYVIGDQARYIDSWAVHKISGSLGKPAPKIPGTVAASRAAGAKTVLVWCLGEDRSPRCDYNKTILLTDLPDTTWQNIKDNLVCTNCKARGSIQLRFDHTEGHEDIGRPPNIIDGKFV